MPLALPSSAPFLGAVAGHRRRSAPVHAARQVANDDSKTHDALVQQAVNALQNCAGKDAELLQLIIGLIKHIDKDKDGAPHGGVPTTPKRRRKPTQKQRRARRAAATAVLQAAVQGWRGRREAARLREAAAARATRPPAAVQAAPVAAPAPAREAEAKQKPCERPKLRLRPRATAVEARAAAAAAAGARERRQLVGERRRPSFRAPPHAPMAEAAFAAQARRDWAKLRTTSVATRARGAMLEKRKHDDGAAVTGSPPKGRRIGAA